MYFSLFLLLGHSHIMVFAKCTPFDSLFSGVLFFEDLILYLHSHNFYHLSPKDPLFCVKTSQIFMSWKTPFSLKTPHQKIPIFEMPDVRHFIQIMCPWDISTPLSALFQSTSVSPTEVSPLTLRSIMQGHRPGGTRWGICTESLPLLLSRVRIMRA